MEGGHAGGYLEKRVGPTCGDRPLIEWRPPRPVKAAGAEEPCILTPVTKPPVGRNGFMKHLGSRPKTRRHPAAAVPKSHDGPLWSLSNIARPGPSHHTASPSITACRTLSHGFADAGIALAPVETVACEQTHPGRTAR